MILKWLADGVERLGSDIDDYKTSDGYDVTLVMILVARKMLLF